LHFVLVVNCFGGKISLDTKFQTPQALQATLIYFAIGKSKAMVQLFQENGQFRNCQ